MDLNARARRRPPARRQPRSREHLVPRGRPDQAPAEDGFDVVMALECLSEIPDDRAALGSMSAALAPEGLFVVQVPDAEWKPVLKGSPTTWREEVRHGYRPAALEAALAEAGLERIEVSRRSGRRSPPPRSFAIESRSEAWHFARPPSRRWPRPSGSSASARPTGRRTPSSPSRDDRDRERAPMAGFCLSPEARRSDRRSRS